MRATDPSWMKTSHTLTDHINTQASDSNGHLHKTQQHNARLFDLNRDKTHTYVFPLDSYNQISITSQDRRTSSSQDALPLKRCTSHDNIEDFVLQSSTSKVPGPQRNPWTYHVDPLTGGQGWSEKEASHGCRRQFLCSPGVLLHDTDTEKHTTCML